MTLVLVFLPTIIALQLNDPCGCIVTLLESSGTYPQATTNGGTFTSNTNDPLSPFYGQSVHFHGTVYSDATQHVASYFIQCTSLCWIETIAITGAAFQSNIWQLWSGNQESLIASLSENSGNALVTYTIDMTTIPFYNNEFVLVENNSDTIWRYRESIILTTTPLTTEITEINGIWFDDHKTVSDPIIAGWSFTPITVTTNGIHNYYGPYNDIIGPSYGSNYIIHRNFKCKYDSQLDIKFSEIHCETGVSDYITPIYAGTIGNIHYCISGSNKPDPAFLPYNCTTWYSGKVSNYTLENIVGGEIFSVSLDIWVTAIEDFIAIFNITISCNAYPTQSPTLNPSKPPTKMPTNNPTSDVPTTTFPTTIAPTTSNPTTVSPTVSDPTTNGPTTTEPSTSRPTTQEPSISPTRMPTLYPISSNPTTTQPTTAIPTTSVPTTVSPTIRTNIPTQTPTSQTDTPSKKPTLAAPTTLNPTKDTRNYESGEIDIDTTYSIDELIENEKKSNKLNVTEHIMFYIIGAIGCCLCIVIFALMKLKHIRNKRYKDKQMEKNITMTNDMSNDIINSNSFAPHPTYTSKIPEEPQYLQDDIVTEIHRDINNTTTSHVTAGGPCLDEPLDTTDENENGEGIDDPDVLEMVNMMTPMSPLSVRSISNESDYNVMLSETKTKGTTNIGVDEFIVEDEQYNTKGYISE